MEDKKKDAWFIEYVLYCAAGFNVFSSLVYTVFSDMEAAPDDKWFSRHLLSIVCLGFAGVIREIRKK